MGNEVYHLTRDHCCRTGKIPCHSLNHQHVTPERDQELLPGDYVEVTCKEAGLKPIFQSKSRGKIRMTETRTKQLYQGIYRIDAQDRLNKSGTSSDP